MLDFFPLAAKAGLINIRSSLNSNVQPDNHKSEPSLMAEINLKKNIILSSSFRSVVLVLSFLMGWVSTRYLGVDLKGRQGYLITIGSFGWMILDMGLFRSYPYLVRKYPEKYDTLLKWSMLTFIAETAILGFLGLAFLRLWSRILDFDFSLLYIIYFVGFITVSKVLMQVQSLFVGLDDIYHSSVGYFLNSFVGFALMATVFFGALGQDRLSYALAAGVLAPLLAFLYLAWHSNWRGWLGKLDLAFIRKSYGFGLRVFISSLFILLLIRVDVIILKQLRGYAEVGIYSLAGHIVDMLQVLSNLVGSLLLVKLADTPDDKAKWMMMKKMLLVFVVFLSIANLGFILLGKIMLRVVFGVEFVPAYYSYLWLIPASYGLSFGSLFNNYLNSKGFPLVSIILPAIALVVNIGLNLLLIPVWGMYGAAFATSVAYLLWFVLIIAYEHQASGNQMLKYLIPKKDDWLQLWGMFGETVRIGLNRVRR